MEMISSLSRRKIGLLVLLGSLVLVAAAMGILLALTLQGVSHVQVARRPGMIRLAWVSLFSLGVVLVLLLWAVIRLMIVTTPKPTHTKTDYVDAWSIAGQRASADDLEDPDQPPAEDGDDEDDEGPDDAGPDAGGKGKP